MHTCVFIITHIFLPITLHYKCTCKTVHACTYMFYVHDLCQRISLSHAYMYAQVSTHTHKYVHASTCTYVHTTGSQVKKVYTHVFFPSHAGQYAGIIASAMFAGRFFGW